ncbi:hypothetical protein Taro_020975 [Colocasia esculenta]|uniref:Retrotransposon gag domain-containing protein n=1 Tax=Colocasia esculenta TaxID=4460 RepID=A0A843V6U3_COLES|nr:hypothetical protein [Colocasia esculenta]
MHRRAWRCQHPDQWTLTPGRQSGFDLVIVGIVRRTSSTGRSSEHRGRLPRLRCAVYINTEQDRGEIGGLLGTTMASRGKRGVPAREDEQRREDRGEQQAPAPQGPTVLPPPPPVDYRVFMHSLVQAMPTQAHTQVALQAQLKAQERADVWWISLLRSRFEDGAVEVAWDEFVRLFRAKFVLEHIQDKME